jgi:hypothetical protein
LFAGIIGSPTITCEGIRMLKPASRSGCAMFVLTTQQCAQDAQTTALVITSVSSYALMHEALVRYGL